MPPPMSDIRVLALKRQTDSGVGSNSRNRLTILPCPDDSIRRLSRDNPTEVLDAQGEA